MVSARKMGWQELENGDLIAAAEREGSEVMVTADKQMQYQQSLADRKICIIVLNALLVKWPHILPSAPHVQRALDGGVPKGSFVIINPDR
jgi:hypothetical protein